MRWRSRPERSRPDSEEAVLRAARRRDREAWTALRHGFGEGTTEARCLLTVDLPGVQMAPHVDGCVPVSELAGDVHPRGYDDRHRHYTCQTWRVERVGVLAPGDAAAVVHLHIDRRRRLRLSAMPVTGGRGFVRGVGRDDVLMIEEWLRSRGSR